MTGLASDSAQVTRRSFGRVSPGLSRCGGVTSQACFLLSCRQSDRRQRVGRQPPGIVGHLVTLGARAASVVTIWLPQGLFVLPVAACDGPFDGKGSASIERIRCEGQLSIRVHVQDRWRGIETEGRRELTGQIHANAASESSGFAERADLSDGRGGLGDCHAPDLYELFTHLLEFACHVPAMWAAGGKVENQGRSRCHLAQRRGCGVQTNEARVQRERWATDGRELGCAIRGGRSLRWRQGREHRQ